MQEFQDELKRWNRYCQAENIDRKKRSNALTKHAKTNIESIYVNNSTPLSLKGTVDKKGVQKMILNATLSKLWKENCEQRVSLSKFQKLRPANVLTVDRHKFN